MYVSHFAIVLFRRPVLWQNVNVSGSCAGSWWFATHSVFLWIVSYDCWRCECCSIYCVLFQSVYQMSMNSSLKSPECYRHIADMFPALILTREFLSAWYNWTVACQIPWLHNVFQNIYSLYLSVSVIQVVAGFSGIKYMSCSEVTEFKVCIRFLQENL